jgi:MoxR-like ATPase
MEGTYPLPEAQLDRFFFKILVPFPGLEDLVEIMGRTTGNTSVRAGPVMGGDELRRLRQVVREVPIAPEILRYAMRLVLGTQATGPSPAPCAEKYLRYGASPRGAQTLVLGARVHALLAGRAHVSIADVRSVAHPALRHRIGLSFDAEAEGLAPDAVVDHLLDEVPEASPRVERELRV